MRATWIAVLISIWVFSAIATSFYTGTAILDNTTKTNPVQGMLQYALIYQQMDFGAFMNVSNHFNFFNDLWKLLILDLPIFSGSFEIMRWILLAPFVGTVVYGLVQVFFGTIRRT
jgi:hypothetical protein